MIDRRQVICLAAAGYVMRLNIGRADAAPFSCAGLSNQDCAKLVQNRIAGAASDKDAIEAWGVWCATFEKAYRNMKNTPVPSSDLDKIETFIADKVEGITNPASIAFGLALKRYLPTLAAVLSLADSAVLLVVWGVLSPSPLQTPLQELNATNDEITAALRAKLKWTPSSTWQSSYSSIVKEAYSIEDPKIINP